MSRSGEAFVGLQGRCHSGKHPGYNKEDQSRERNGHPRRRGRGSTPIHPNPKRSGKQNGHDPSELKLLEDIHHGPGKHDGTEDDDSPGEAS